MVSKKLEFENSRKQTLRGILDLPKNLKEPLPIVVILHSFTGYKELKHLYEIAQFCVQNNLLAFRFDFSDCIGESDGTCYNMKLSNQVADTIDALNFVKTLPEVDETKIGLCGHSLGGTTAINAAAQFKKLKCLVTIAALAKPDWEHLFSDKKIENWKKTGVTDFQSYKRGKISIGFEFYQDIINHKCGEAISEINCPLRVLHGTKDEILDLMNAAYLYDNAKEPKEIKLIEQADHMFLKDPFKKQMAELVVEFMTKNLR